MINDRFICLGSLVAEDLNAPLQEHMMTSLFALDPWHGGLMYASSQRPPGLQLEDS